MPTTSRVSSSTLRVLAVLGVVALGLSLLVAPIILAVFEDSYLETGYDVGGVLPVYADLSASAFTIAVQVGAAMALLTGGLVGTLNERTWGAVVLRFAALWLLTLWVAWQLVSINAIRADLPVVSDDPRFFKAFELPLAAWSLVATWVLRRVPLRATAQRSLG